MYKNPVAQLRVSGTLSKNFNVYKKNQTRRQAIAALKFALGMESLTEAVGQTDQITGINGSRLLKASIIS